MAWPDATSPDADAREAEGASVDQAAAPLLTIATDRAISQSKRQILLGRTVHWGLLVVAVGSMAASPLIAGADQSRVAAIVGFLPLAAAGVWLVLGAVSARTAAITIDVPVAVAAGLYGLAEDRVARAVGSFCLFRAPRLIGLHQLASLRSAQDRPAETAALCRAVLNRPGAAAAGLFNGTSLLLADAGLKLNDLPTVHNCLARLWGHRVNLAESLKLLELQLDYQSRTGAWSTMAEGLEHKVEMAELMPAESAAGSQALLALAARRMGRPAWAEWLGRRADLLADRAELIKRRPALAELWD